MSPVGTPFVQQKLLPIVLLTATALAAGFLASRAAAQEWTGFAPEGWATGYAPPGPYLPGNRLPVPGPPVTPTQVSRPASWPGTVAGPRQWNPPSDDDSRQSWAAEYPQTAPIGYPAEQTSVPAYPRTSADAAEDPFQGRTNRWPPGYSSQYPQPSYGSGFPGEGISQPPQPPVATPMEPCESAQILARVGSQVILACEVVPAVDEALSRYKDQIPSHQLEIQRRLLIEQQLKIPIETELIYLDARRSIPEENLPHVEKTLADQFEKSELKSLMEKAEVQTRRELDEKLQSMGSSLERRKKAFIKRALAQTWVREQLNFKEEPTYDQIWEYYSQNREEFKRPTRARWEELMVSFAKYPSKGEAYAAIAGMGDQVRAGVPWDQVARRLSDGTTASEGGRRDWTHKGSLVCEELDRALFGLPVQGLSPIIESESGLHIIRVIEREMGGYVPFSEAQTKIRPKIHEQQSAQQLRKYVARLREQIPVWTVFDDPPRDQQVSSRDGQPQR